MLNYKNYIASVKFDDEAEIFHGEVINTRDVITFQGKSVKEIKQAFRDSIDDYLEFCAKRNEAPDKPFSGNFNLRLDPSLHQKMYIVAKEKGVSLNKLVINVLSCYLHESHA